MPPTTNLANKIEKNLPAELAGFIQIAGEVAAKHGQNLYLVGGVVRDLFLGLPHLDLDLVVEGDAITLARSIPLKHPKITVHPDFGTAKIKWSKWSIDLATARSETYARPGALPEVTPSTIQKDLFRRDFTINAMAISLNPGNYGELIDPYRGLSDLKRRLIRILHNSSFIDDATRIWRAIRYEQRLDFEIEPDTLRLLKRDINILDTISGDRIRHELELALKEKFPEKIMRRAGEIKVLQKLHPSLKGNGWLVEKFEAARELGLTNSSLVTVYLALLIYLLTGAELEQLITSLHLTRALTQNLKDTIELKDKLPSLMPQSLSPSEVYFTLCDYSPLAIIANSLATDATVVEQNIDNYLSRLRHIKPRLNGDDLKKIGITQGTEIKRILHELHIARLNGKVTTKQGETRLVYHWLGLNQVKPDWSTTG